MVDQTTVPAMPEITLTGMKNQLMPRILQCSKGGYVVIFDGHGITATTSYKEAIEKIMEVGAEVLGENYEPDVPLPKAFYEQEPPPRRKEVNIGRVLHVAFATVATCLIAIGVKVA